MTQFFTPTNRGAVRVVLLAAIAFLFSLTHGDPTIIAPLIIAAVLAVYDLVVAIVYSHSPLRKALYVFAAALQPVAIALNLGTDEQWTLGLQLVSAVFAIGVAARFTPTTA